MANIGLTKRRASSSKSFESTSTRMSSPDMPFEMKSSERKRRRISSTKPENESSNDSFSHSNYIPSEGEGSSDSEFEEHPYSRSSWHSGKSNDHPRQKFESDVSTFSSQIGTISKRSSKRSKCTSKNAVMARINRLKKKKYIEDLENKNEELEAENQMLKNMLESRAKEVETLKRKALNLESVIRNKTEIGSLLRCVRQHTNLEISSSLMRPTNSPNEEKAEKLNSSKSNELEVSPCEEEGNTILNFDPEPFGSPLGFLDISEDKSVDFVNSNPLLSDIDSWFKPSRFDLPESPASDEFGGIVSPPRCETPSKGITISANKENLFDDVGVCFHIANKKVSLEFCDSCNHMASL